MISVEEYAKIYKMLDRMGPAPYDCGKLCGSICCNEGPFEEEGSYIYLLPGEKEYLESAGCGIPIVSEKREEHYLPASWGENVYIAKCPGVSGCDRKCRPIQCRTFPLQAYISDEGRLEVTLYYEDLPYRCPFVAGEEMISDDFVCAVYDAWSILIKDAAVRDLVEQDSAGRYQMADCGLFKFS